MAHAMEVGYDEAFIINSRGLKLFTCRWMPIDQEPKALIFICIGYAMDCSITMNSTATRLAKAGFAVHGIDYEGHGKSAGHACYIDNFDDLVVDCNYHFTSICERRENRGKMRFLLGECMGGAVALLLHRKNPNYWDGAVLVAPMCKVAEKLRLPPLVKAAMKKLTKFGPTWKIVPTSPIIDIAIKEPEIRKEIKENPYCYKGRPCLKTGQEIIRICLDLQQRLEEVSLPFLVLHGGEDKVIDIAASEKLYDVALSTDKTFKLYPGMWHGILYGESLDNIDIVFADIINWLDERTSLGNPRSEREQKLKNENSLTSLNNSKEFICNASFSRWSL